MTFDILFKLSVFVVAMVVIGSVLCLPLFKGDVKKLLASPLFVKIIWWLPIYLVLVAVLYGEFWSALFLTLALLLLAAREFARNKGLATPISRWYLAVFLLATAHIVIWFAALPVETAAYLFAGVAITSVMSDVTAFFLGNYAGRTKLPSWLNNRKSWEGVLGQLIGAGFGGIVAISVGIDMPLGLIAVVGVASAVGDLINSAAKRSLRIKDWGNTIPGHGGVLDRLSSLSLAVVASFWFIVLTTLAFKVY